MHTQYGGPDSHRPPGAPGLAKIPNRQYYLAVNYKGKHMATTRILVIDDSPEIRMSAAFILEDHGFEVEEADTPLSAQQWLKTRDCDLILLDMNFSLDTTSGEEGLGFLRWLQQQKITTPVVSMTAWSNVDLAVKAMQLGANDFIEKPWNNQRLLQIIRQQLTMAGLEHQNQKLRQQLEPVATAEFSWRSDAMQLLLRQLDAVAATDASILLTGDNGTGKSHLARHIHQHSHRRQAPFISVNMGAISESLFESEMFGHKKGAFTDAKEHRIGRFELAKSGTLFMDEVANLPASQQAKLLRVLESGEFEVLGSSQTQLTDIRIISATNGDIPALIANERFREDLYYRLNTLELRVPSLAERQADIEPLANHFIRHHGAKYQRPELALAPCAVRALEGYHWPGNIREMSHLMERAVLLSQGSRLTVEDLHLSNAYHGSSTPSAAAIPTPQPEEHETPIMTLAEAELKLLKQALRETNDNITQAAKLLGLTKSSMYRRLEKYQLVGNE